MEIVGGNGWFVGVKSLLPHEGLETPLPAWNIIHITVDLIVTEG